MRHANIKHGFYARAGDEALRALGEDPEDRKPLVKETIATWHPANGFETRLVTRLAQALWLLDRDDRWHESVAVRQLRRLDENYERMAREAETQFQEKHAALKRILEAAKQEDYCTGVDEIVAFADVFGDEPTGQPLETQVLLYRLLKPGTPAHGATPADYKGLEASPDVPIAEDHHRPPVRRELREHLEAEIEALKAAHASRLEVLRQESSDPYLRETMMAPTHPQAELMQRAKSANLQVVERLTNLLLKIRGKGPAAYAANIKNEGASHDLTENKGGEEVVTGTSHDVDEKKAVSMLIPRC
jgi:hypothetical protein